MLGYRNSARRSRELTGCRIAQGHGVCLKIDGSLLQKKKVCYLHASFPGDFGGKN